MHTVKDAGRASFQFHRAGASAAELDRRARLKLDRAMRQALANNRSRLHYQPQVDMQTGQVRGAEALLRWHDAELGEMSPGVFVPATEQSGFIVALDEAPGGAAGRPLVRPAVAVELGRRLGVMQGGGHAVEIVAVGVETEDQRRFLQQTGCERYQGSLFAPALATAGFEALLAQALARCNALPS